MINMFKLQQQKKDNPNNVPQKRHSAAMLRIQKGYFYFENISTFLLNNQLTGNYFFQMSMN